jgi:hypothetical protein
MKKTIVLLTVLLTVITLKAQKKTEFTLTLKDGNVVTGETKISNVTLSTDYGKLEIPIKNVSSIELGLHADNGQKAKISALVKQLNNSNEEMRSNTYKEITSLSASTIPVLEEISYSSDYVPGDYSDYSLSNAISELKVMHNISDNYKTKDIVSIDYEYNMGGVYSFKTIELKTQYGTLNIPRDKIEKIDVMYYDASEEGGMKTFKLFANKHISGNKDGGWFKTGIKVKNGQSIDMISTGEITLASLSNQAYKPDGSHKNSGSNDFTPNSSTSNYPVYGNSVYKIGESGTAVKAGKNYKGRASTSGMLYISIYETVYNASNTGFYIVKLKVK